MTRDGETFLQDSLTAINKRFPVLSVIRIGTREEEMSPIPAFIGLIASILESADKPCCVVLPDATGVALATALVTATATLRRDSATLLRAFADNSLERGERVQVDPCGLVYEYDGFFTPQHFRLKVIERNDSRSLPVADVARLEKTSRKRPKGHLNSDLGSPRPTVLGTLIEIPGAVNRNFLRNHVLILGQKKEFLELSQSWKVDVTESKPRLGGILGEEIPLGEVTEEGTLRFFDEYISSGEPPIAIATRPEDLLIRCARIAPHSCGVLVNDVERLARNLQAFDAIVDCQNLVVIAEEAQHEHIRVLQERGCDVWRFSSDEIFLGINDPNQGTPFRVPLNKAANMRDLVISSTSCADPTLDEVAGALSACAKAMPKNNDNQTVRDLFIRLFSVLMTCAEHVGTGTEAFLGQVGTRLEQANALLRRSTPWISGEIATSLSDVIKKLSDISSRLSGEQVTAKGKAILDALAGIEAHTTAAIVTRSEARRDELRTWLDQQGHTLPVFRVNEVPWERDFDQLLMVAWPNAKRFDKLLRQYSTRQLDVLAYSFERLWLGDYRREYEQTQLRTVTTRRKGRLLGLFELAPEESEEPCPTEGPFDLPVERFLIRRKSSSVSAGSYDPTENIEAYYVDFAGSTFAYLSEGHQIPLVNQFMLGNEHTASVPYRAIEDLRVGDFVLFRDTGDSDIIRFIVEDEIGAVEYQRLRGIASRWKAALLRIGPDAKTVWKKLNEAGVSKHQLTVKNWFSNEQLIGPKAAADIELIARVAQDSELQLSISSVVEVIEQIRGYHVGAGSRLTKMLLQELSKRTGDIQRGEMEIDLGVGKVWIVRIQEIDESTTSCSRSVVNRLLWDEASD